MIIHISQERFDRITSQGYRLGDLDLTPGQLASLPKGDNEYHMLDGDHGACSICKAEFDGVIADNPVELEYAKLRMATA